MVWGWSKIRSNIPLERVNKEIKRRTGVVGILQTPSAVVRPVGTIMGERHEEWQVAGRYVSAESLAKLLGCLHGVCSRIQRNRGVTAIP